MLILPRLFLRAGGWMGLVLIAIAWIMLPLSIHQTFETRALKDQGVQVLGVITDKWQSPGSDAILAIDYTFAPEGGAPLSVSHHYVSARFWAAHPVGAAIPITYLPENPAVNAAEPSDMRHGAWIGMLVGLALAALGLGLSFWAAHHALRAWEARRDVREVVDGVVTHRRLVRLISELEFTRLPEDAHPTHTSFPRLLWGHGWARKGTPVRLALTGNGTWLLSDLMLPKDFAPGPVQ